MTLNITLQPAGSIPSIARFVPVSLKWFVKLNILKNMIRSSEKKSFISEVPTHSGKNWLIQKFFLKTIKPQNIENTDSDNFLSIRVIAGRYILLFLVFGDTSSLQTGSQISQLLYWLIKYEHVNQATLIVVSEKLDCHYLMKFQTYFPWRFLTFTFLNRETEKIGIWWLIN